MPPAAPETDAQPLPRCPAPGVTPVAGGADVAVHAPDASSVWLTTQDALGREHRHRLPRRREGWWFGHVPGLAAGTRYGLRADGPWAPERGHRFNPAKLLLDPYARAIDGGVRLTPAVYGHVVDDAGRGDHRVRSDLDSAPDTPRAVVVDLAAVDRPAQEPERSAPASAPRHPADELVIYEAHVVELTRRLPAVPEQLRGTYAALGHPATIAHLRELGVTALELLPVHAFAHEPHLVRRGLTNHWGYTTLGFFAPHQPYSATPEDPQATVRELQDAIAALHAAGIEVLLDVVYNHTAEQGVDGTTLSWRGLSAARSYRLDERGRDIDVTGCGNTLDLTDTATQRMVLDSLRHWVTRYGVDGFRFDLAVALARGAHEDFERQHSFLTALRTDPVLSQVRLIAEPWDIGPHGWRTGQFPPPFAEWNDRYRDAVRTFWLTDAAARARGERGGHGMGELATRLAGSHDLFGGHDRGPEASVSFVTAHDGFTLADLTAYDHKHNEANGEDGRDGSDHDLSWNHGVEGPTDDPSVLAARRRTARGMLGTLLLSTGTPMIASGDEIGRTTDGNNNPYAQANALSWLDWDLDQPRRDLLATTAHLTRLRRELPVLRRRAGWSAGGDSDGAGSDLSWFDEHGAPMTTSAWEQADRRTLQLVLDGRPLGHRSALLVLHGGPHDATLTLPPVPGASGWVLEWDSAWESPGGRRTGEILSPRAEPVGAASLRLYSAAG
ncbi:glycogen debranching protein GlgX [Janibacter alkaliphilus]|uniref:Glycogen operon protein n=1 Tax=Janibacter alkaliphilus TaxID=1069963 RepID=A0A852X2A6_9MICO|nr:glycogen debranching protein GlgX [Janibacter alkaliphilus]NYG37462.1 glycogen operon protein [Janibacter alkaliphilus]